MSPSNGIANSNFNCNNNSSSNKNYIEHPVSKLDTLAGVAIKYGVEVADIKRLNGLATDLQMFALKTLKIPLPGRHPPSHGLSNGSSSSGTEKPPPHLGHYNMLETFQPRKSKSPQQKAKSSAMSTLQKYYNLPEAKRTTETEMAIYRRGSLDSLNELLLSKTPQKSDQPNFKCLHLTEAGNSETDKSSEKSVRRRSSTAEASTPEWLLKEDFGSGNSGFSSGTGKGKSMRPKSASRISVGPELDSVWLNSILGGLGDSLVSDGPALVHKSSSTPNFQDQENGNSSVWPVSWSLKSDLQTFSTIPIFDGLPKPIKSKAARD